MGNVEIGDRVRIEAGSSLPDDFKVPRDAIGTVKQKHSDSKSKGVWIEMSIWDQVLATCLPSMLPNSSLWWDPSDHRMPAGHSERGRMYTRGHVARGPRIPSPGAYVEPSRQCNAGRPTVRPSNGPASVSNGNVISDLPDINRCVFSIGLRRG
jgi:hypothetical protein